MCHLYIIICPHLTSQSFTINCEHLIPHCKWTSTNVPELGLDISGRPFAVWVTLSAIIYHFFHHLKSTAISRPNSAKLRDSPSSTIVFHYQSKSAMIRQYAIIRNYLPLS